ncbi:MAG: TonB-dependent receptor [Cyclobacteriaceae bacterium]|nr:TonB-dependent receptor [Cyclobacteriaceae bacterium]
MKYIPILMLVTIFPTVNTVGQMPLSDATIVGDVQCNGVHIPYISVFVKGTTIGTTTDETGHFQLVNLPVGKYTIVARGMGYRSEEVHITTNLNTTEEIKFKLIEDVLNLDGVVVSADRKETSRNEAPVVVSTITPRLFETSQAVCIANGLDFVPGVRMECNCQNCGFSQVRMNGLDGPYSQILINSRPVFSGLAGVYGLELIPTSMVERIEIVRGGGSALFGGNAIAGTVNIITKEPLVNSFSLDGRYSLTGVGNYHGTDPAADRLVNINGSAVTDDLSTGLSFFGMFRDRDAFDENGDEFTEMVLMENTTFGMNAFHKFNDHNKLSLDLYRINEFRRGGNKLDYLPHETDITEQVHHKITGLNIAMDVFTGNRYRNKLMVYAAGQTVDRDSYYGAEMDPAAYGYTFDITSSVGGQYFMNLGERSTFLLGIDDNFNKLKDTKLGAGGDPNSLIVNQFTNTIGTFGQYEWSSGIFKTSLGLRFDSYLIRDLGNNDPSGSGGDITGNVLAPRLNMLFGLPTGLQFRAAYSKGYRAPQIFDEDLHIEASGARRTLHINSPDLKQESSHSVISSLRYVSESGPVLMEMLLEGFYTRLLDPFAYVYESIDSTGTLVKIRRNAEDGAYVTGVNLEFNAAFPNNLRLQAGFTLQTSRYDTPQPWGEGPDDVTTRFLRTPASYGYLTLDWNPVHRLDISLTANYTGRMYVPHYGLTPVTEDEWELINSGNTEALEGRQSEIEAILNGDVIEGERLEHSEPFLVFGFRLAYDIPIAMANLQVYGGVQNIFNQLQANHDSGVYRDAGYVYGPCQPRTINLGVKISSMGF